MKTLIIACRTIADELNMVASGVGCKYPILLIESGLHLSPDLLKKRIQEELSRIANVERVLLAFGFCGNALLGITPLTFEIVFPRVDDCITLLLGSYGKRREISREMGTYFLTKGWLDYETNIWSDYQKTLIKYGKEKTDRLYKTILENYKRLAVIETGAFQLDSFLERTKYIARDLKLKHQVIPGTLSYIEKLLTGPWDEDFVIVGPGEAVTLEHLPNFVPQ